MGQACVVCEAEKWTDLVEPHPSRSVRTDGVTELLPLRRRQCSMCGLGYRAPTENLSQLYAQDYALYTNRPGADAFNRQRHPELVSRIAESVEPLRPARILEIGCGDGSTLSAMREFWPHAETVGLEPSCAAAECARARGHRVIEGMVGPSLGEEVEGRFDLIVSIQVIEHTADPVAFLAAQTSRLTPHGVVATVCPNGAVPHAEIIHPDHLFSFAPAHLTVVATQAGLIRRGGCEFELGEAHEFNQLLVASRAPQSMTAGRKAVPTVARNEVDRLEHMRNAYLRRWSCLEEDLDMRIGPAMTVMCFGTGGWSAYLAGYAPDIWERVRACTVDDPATTTFLNKPVVRYSSLHEEAPDVVIVGVNPGRQDMVSRRLRRDGYRTVQWNDLIDR